MSARLARLLPLTLPPSFSSSVSRSAIQKSTSDVSSLLNVSKFWLTSAYSSSPKRGKNLADRLSALTEAVNDRKLPPELRGNRNAVRTETDIVNVVEQRIWHSMEEGDFENLPGKGKPLKLSSNPYADPAEDTLYRILSQNKCVPEWVDLNKEIRSKVSEWRAVLKRAWTTKCDGDVSNWNESSETLKQQLRYINDQVFRYNLIVPFGRQMHGLKWEKELSRVEEEMKDAQNVCDEAG